MRLRPVLFSLLLVAASHSALASPPSGVVDKVRAYRADNEKKIVGELVELLSIPNVASDGENIERNAAQLVKMLEGRGFTTDLLRVEGAPPVVFGELPVEGATTTITFYAHYDGQPADAAEWASDPWHPVMRDGILPDGKEVDWQDASSIGDEWRLFARSASDDKGPIVALLAALDGLRAHDIPLSVNLKVFLDGEEEAGSPHLGEILRTYWERLGSDLWIFADGPVHQSRAMQVYYGVRGIVGLEMTLYGATRTLHSGHYGNWAPNPIAELANLLAAMRDDEGRILIDDFYEDFRPLSDAEKGALARVPGVEEMLREDLAIGRTEGGGITVTEAVTRPALNIRGILGGYVGEKATTSIPTSATASIDFRLVPDQTPERVRRRVETFLESRGYEVVTEAPDRLARREHSRLIHLTWRTGYPSARTPMELPLVRRAVAAIEEASGSVVELPTLGGSLPLYLFRDILGADFLGVPIVNHDNAQHAANENLRMKNLFDGIEIYANLLARTGRRSDLGQTSIAP
jgi:acetylornithine deacetylase/succinyl-diaminopimelate desuccinylase-like protein